MGRISCTPAPCGHLQQGERLRKRAFWGSGRPCGCRCASCPASKWWTNASRGGTEPSSWTLLPLYLCILALLKNLGGRRLRSCLLPPCLHQVSGGLKNPADSDACMEHKPELPPPAALSPVFTDLVSNQSAEGLLEDCDLFGPARDDVLAMAVKMANVLDEPGQDLEADFPKSEGSPRGGWARQEWARRAADVSSPSLGGDPRLGSPPPCVRTLSGWHLPGVEGRRGGWCAGRTAAPVSLHRPPGHPSQRGLSLRLRPGRPRGRCCRSRLASLDSQGGPQLGWPLKGALRGKSWTGSLSLTLALTSGWGALGCGRGRLGPEGARSMQVL